VQQCRHAHYKLLHRQQVFRGISLSELQEEHSYTLKPNKGEIPLAFPYHEFPEAYRDIIEYQLGNKCRNPFFIHSNDVVLTVFFVKHPRCLLHLTLCKQIQIPIEFCKIAYKPLWLPEYLQHCTEHKPSLPADLIWQHHNQPEQQEEVQEYPILRFTHIQLHTDDNNLSD